MIIYTQHTILDKIFTFGATLNLRFARKKLLHIEHVFNLTKINPLQNFYLYHTSFFLSHGITSKLELDPHPTHTHSLIHIAIHTHTHANTQK